MGQEAATFAAHGFGPLDGWQVVEAAARGRRWFDDGDGTLAVLIASTSDLDDLIPTLVAYQIEWNKVHRGAAAQSPPDDVDADWCADALGGSVDDWLRVGEAWAGGLSAFVDEVRAHELELRVRMLGGSEVGYARVT